MNANPCGKVAGNGECTRHLSRELMVWHTGTTYQVVKVSPRSPCHQWATTLEDGIFEQLSVEVGCELQRGHGPLTLDESVPTHPHCGFLAELRRAQQAPVLRQLLGVGIEHRRAAILEALHPGTDGTLTQARNVGGSDVGVMLGAATP